ncbi:hypothetical protein HELRODRAFT_135521, partial [Helobdella robusta]
LLFIHGESYDFGSGNVYDGSGLASAGNHIVITLNFRLGVLGFLSTEDSSASGNYALLDIIAGLRWIQENIRAFNGDPDRVTLLGHGYGAALANLVATSPLVRDMNLFRGIILQSGTALSPWATVMSPLPVTRRVAENLNC